MSLNSVLIPSTGDGFSGFSLQLSELQKLLQQSMTTENMLAAAVCQAAITAYGDRKILLIRGQNAVRVNFGGVGHAC